MNDDAKTQARERLLTATVAAPAMLALDTSTAALAAAVVRGRNVLAERQSMAERNHSVLAVPTLHAALADAGLTPQSLGGIAVGRGPGSYTGVRIAVTIGKTLAWAWGVPLVGVSSLEALACGAYYAALPGEDEPQADELPEPEAAQTGGPVSWIVPLMDARRGQVYSSLYAAGGDGGWRALAGDGIRQMRDWADELHRLARAAAARPLRMVLTGDLSLHEGEAERLRALLDGSGVAVELASRAMEGRWIGALGARRLSRGEADDIHSFVPNYTQLAEAEVKLMAARQEE